MSDVILGTSVNGLKTGTKITAYTGVILHAGQDSEGKEKVYSSGDNTGYVLEANNPLGTQAMADNILAGLKLRGAQYQPYEAGGALLNPAAEIGDNVSINGVSGVILSKNTRHSRLMRADISAPFDEEVDHEFTYEPRSVREFKRESAYTRARLSIDEDSIEAKVSKEGGESESFGWILTSDAHTWYSNSSEVLRVNSDGLYVRGEIVATSGVIGGCSIVNGVLQVDSANIRSINADYITVGTLNVDRIASGSIGGDDGNGKITASSISTYNTSSGINGGVGGGISYNLATSGASTPDYPSTFRVAYLYVTSGISMNSAVYTPQTKTISGTTIHYLGW